MEARELLERVVKMEASPTRHGWAWYDLGRVRSWLGKPASEMRAAFRKAVELCPHERRFTDALHKTANGSGR